MNGTVAVSGAAHTRRDAIKLAQDLMSLSSAEPGLVLAAIAEARQLNAADLIREILLLERNRLQLRAEAVAQQVWNEDARRRADEDWQDNARYVVRVKSRMFSVSIEWGRKVFFQKGGQRRMLFKWLKRGKRASMDRSLFSEALPWELEQVERAEAQFAGVRIHAAYLARIGRNLRFDPDVGTPGTIRPMFFDLQDTTLR